MASASAGPPTIDKALRRAGRKVEAPRAAESPQPVREPVAALPAWRVRDLPPEEWGKLQQIPMVAQGLLNPDPQIYRAIVAELGTGPDAQLIGCWFAYNAPHLEPVWIHPDHRKRPGLIRQLWSKTIGLLREMNVRIAFCTVADEVALTSMPLVLRLGFQRVRADAYLLDLGDPETRARVDAMTREGGS